MGSIPGVVHCKKAKYDVYIGRAVGRSFGDSIWDNPFHITKNRTREEVIELYRAYLLSTPKLMKQLPKLKGKVVGCWCAPLPCHGDILVELANQ